MNKNLKKKVILNTINQHKKAFAILPDGNEATLDVKKDSEDIKLLVEDFMKVPYAIIILDDSTLLLHDLYEIPEEAKELIIHSILNKPDNFTGNRFKEVFDLVEDNIWGCVLVEQMVRYTIIENEYTPETIPEVLFDEMIDTINYIQPEDFDELDEIFDLLVLNQIRYLKALEERKEEVANVNFSLNEKFIINKIKKSVLDEDNAVNLSLIALEEQIVRRLDVENTPKEKDVEYLISRFMLLNEVMLSLMIKNGNGLPTVKVLRKTNNEIASMHEEFRNDDLFIAQEWVI